MVPNFFWVKGDNEYGQLGTGNTAKVDNYTKILSGGVAGQKEFKVFKAIPTASSILIDGKKVSFGAYTTAGGELAPLGLSTVRNVNCQVRGT